MKAPHSVPTKLHLAARTRSRERCLRNDSQAGESIELVEFPRGNRPSSHPVCLQPSCAWKRVSRFGKRVVQQWESRLSLA